MKNNSFSRIAFSTFCLLLSAAGLSAQQNTLQCTPLQPVIGKFSIEYEHAIGPRTTLMVEYQRWFERRSAGAGLFLLGIPAAFSDETTNFGKRFSAFARFYNKQAFQGGFMEVGLYAGVHNIKTVTETSVLLPDPSLFFFPNVQTSRTEERHDRVRVHGLRVGGGVHKVKRNFSFEFSGGLSLNGNAENVRPTLGMKNISPYTRMAIGFGF